MRKIILILVLVFVIFSITVSASRLPTVGGDSGAWGTVLNDFLNVSHNGSGELRNGTISNLQIIDGTITDEDISDTINLTLGEKIIFNFGEIIDNIVDGWIRITGNLNLTGNATVDGYIKVGNINPRSTENRIMAEGGFVSHGGYIGETVDGGSYLRMFDDPTTIKSGSNGRYLVDSSIFCDVVLDGFDATDDDPPKKAITITSGNYSSATARVFTYINSSCVELNFNPGWDEDITGVSWIERTGLRINFVEGGAYDYNIGTDEEATFKIGCSSSHADQAVLINTGPGVHDNIGLSLGYWMGNYEGMIGMKLNMRPGVTPESITNKDVTAFLMEADSTWMNGSDGAFIDWDIIGTPIVAGEFTGIKSDPGLTNIIKEGSADTINSAYYESTNITANVINDGADIEVLTNDNEVIYFGSTTNFTSLSIELATDSSKDVGFNFYYCNDAGYHTLGTITDSTNGLVQSGSIEFENPTDRGICNFDIDGTLFGDLNNYTYIALERTTNNVVTPPVIDFSAISGSSSTFLLRKDLLKLNPTNNPPTCDATMEGGIYYDATANVLNFCDGSSWGPV